MSDLSAVLGATTTMKTLADGTFRISVDVEPRFAQQAFALFGAPGTPIALARITNEAAVEQDRKEQREPEKKGGELARMAAMLVKDREFLAFMYGSGLSFGTEEAATQAIYDLCGVESRAMLDHDDGAAEVFHRVIRGPWLKWRTAKGLK